MPKPWGRIELDYINHDKFRAINANAICLWHEGKNYCDLRLTDGLIPTATAKLFRFYGQKAVQMLTTSAGQKPGTEQTYAPLWEVVDGFGFKMHDYLEHNDSRERVQQRIKEIEAKRIADRERLERWRAAKKTQAETARETPDETPNETPDETRFVRSETTAVKRSKTETEPADRTSISKEPVSLARARASDDDLGDRARELLESYPVWYAQERHGARLPLLGGNLQWQEAMTLCRTWDDARLEKLARIVLSTDDPFIAKTDRGWKIFTIKASWADDKLRQFERENGLGVGA